jgi:FtsP/CotA-like multicopper oxidase with cupredoxin domain
MGSDQMHTTYTRRRVLGWIGMGASLGIGLGTGVLALDNAGLLHVPGISNNGTRPSFPRAASTGRIKHYTLDAAPVQVMIGGKQVKTWAYNAMVPGPEIRLTEGDTLRVTVNNHLPEGTTIHWHGVPLINKMDGVPDVTQAAIPSGHTFTYEFLAPAAGTYLYHSHAGLQLDRGLYGALIIEPAKESLQYDQEAVLVLDDWLDGMPGTPDTAMQKLIAGGDRMGSMSGMNGMGGMAKDVPPDLLYPLYLISGKASDNPLEIAVAQGQKLRLRLMNASASTIYKVALQGHRFIVTHTDGQPVEPVTVDALRIGMGERYDVLVTANNPGVWQLAAQVEGAKNMVRAIVRYKGCNDQSPPITFIPPELTRQMLHYNQLRAAQGIYTPPSDTPDQIVPIQLSGGMGQYIWRINNQVFSKADQIMVGKDNLVRFQFESKSEMPHPMHLHGHFFQLENGTGRGPLKDTVLVDPMQTLSVNWVSDNPGLWAFHCHNRYHEMAGMMRVVKVA